MIPCPFAVIGFSAFFVLSLLCNQSAEIAAAAAVLFAAAFLVSVTIRAVRRERVIPVSLASCVIASCLLAGALNLEYKPAMEYVGETCRVTCRLTDSGTTEYGASYYTAQVLTVDGEAADLKVRLRFSSPIDAKPYDIVKGDFSFYEIGKNYKSMNASVRAARIFVGAYAGDSYVVESVPEDEKPLAFRFYTVREAIKQTVYRFLPDERGGLAIALLTGDKSGIEEKTLSAFRDVGTSHIICVSGMHLSIWAMFLLRLAKKLRIGTKAASAVSGVIVLGYMALTGFSFSVVRAGIMCLVFLAGNIISREKDSLNSLGFAVTAILLVNPFAAGDFSLRLSFLSTLGIICGFSAVMPRINEFIRKRWSGLRLKAVNNITVTLLSTLCAVAFTMPIILPEQTGADFICIVSNLLTVFAAMACMILSGLMVLLSYLPFIGGLAVPAAKAAGFISQYIISIARRLAELDILEFYYDKDLAKLWLAGALILAGIAALLALRGKKTVAVASTAICVTFAVMLGVSAVFGSRTARITVTDVGNGTAVIVSKGNKGILLGCGGDEFNSANEIVYAMKNSAVTDLKLMLIPRGNDTESVCAIDILGDIKPEAAAYSALPSGAELLLNTSNSTGACFERTEVLPGVYLKSVVNENSCYAVVDFNNSEILISFYPGGEILAQDRSADILISRSDVPECLDLSAFDLIVLTGGDKALCTQNELLSRRLPAAATAGSGNIVLLTQGDGVFESLRENQQ